MDLEQSTNNHSPRGGTPTGAGGQPVARTVGSSDQAGEVPHEILDDDEHLSFARHPPTLRVACKYLLVTYPRADGCRVGDIIDHLRRAQLEFRLGRERHADGGVHYHALCRKLGGKRIDSVSPRFLDVRCDGRVFHPNLQIVYRTPERAWDYVGKEGDVCVEDFGREDCEVGAGARKSQAAWLACLDAPTKDEVSAFFVLTQPPGGEHGMIESCGPGCDMYLFFTR